MVGYAYASNFHTREAYSWCVETSIYVKQDMRRMGIGRELYHKLENLLKEMNIYNLNACIAYSDVEDEH